MYRMLEVDPAKRPTAEECLKHPIYYPSSTSHQMIIDIVSEGRNSEVLQFLDNPRGLFPEGGEWRSLIDEGILEMAEKKARYDYSSTPDLYRFVRNNLAHMGPLIESIVHMNAVDYFISRFPLLTVRLYRADQAMAIAHLDPDYRPKVYAPPTPAPSPARPNIKQIQAQALAQAGYQTQPQAQHKRRKSMVADEDSSPEGSPVLKSIQAPAQFQQSRHKRKKSMTIDDDSSSLEAFSPLKSAQPQSQDKVRDQDQSQGQVQVPHHVQPQSRHKRKKSIAKDDEDTSESSPPWKGRPMHETYPTPMTSRKKKQKKKKQESDSEDEDSDPDDDDDLEDGDEKMLFQGSYFGGKRRRRNF